MSDDLKKARRVLWEYDNGRLFERCYDRIEALEARVAAADKLAELLKEARVDLAGYVAADWPEDLRAKYPTYENKHRRDMALCWQIDAALAAYQATKEGE